MTTASRKHPLILLLYNLVLVVGLIIGAVIQASPEELLHFVLVQVDVTTIVAVFVVVHIAGAALTDAFSFQTTRPLSLFLDSPQQEPVFRTLNPSVPLTLFLYPAELLPAVLHRKSRELPGQNLREVHQSPGVKKADGRKHFPAIFHGKPNPLQQRPVVGQSILGILGLETGNQPAGKVIVVFAAHLLGDKPSSRLQYPVHFFRPE